MDTVNIDIDNIIDRVRSAYQLSMERNRYLCENLMKSRISTVLKLECWYMSLSLSSISSTCPILTELDYALLLYRCLRKSSRDVKMACISYKRRQKPLKSRALECISTTNNSREPIFNIRHLQIIRQRPCRFSLHRGSFHFELCFLSVSTWADICHCPHGQLLNEYYLLYDEMKIGFSSSYEADLVTWFSI